jgi:hypothetical protein
MKNRAIEGLWWFPANPDDRWIGTLMLVPGKSPRLELTITKGFDFKAPETLPALHGCDKHGSPITLLHLGRSDYSISSVLSIVSYTGGYALLGIEVADSPPFHVNSLSFGMQHLYEWGGISGIMNDVRNNFENETIQYRRPKDQSHSISSDLSFEIKAVRSGRNTFNKRQIKEDLCISFHSVQGLKISECLDLVHAIRHLVHFGILETVFPMWINFGKNGHGRTVQEHFYPLAIEFWSSEIRRRAEASFLPGDWLFRLSDIQIDVAKIIGNWLEYVKKYEEALECYFATIYHLLPDSIEHLCLTQAFDAYHGIKFASHKNRKFECKILDLAKANEAHLAGIVDDIDEFARTVLENRNYYTHHNPIWKKNGRVLFGAKLQRLNEKLKLLFQMCVLTDIGVAPGRFGRLRRQIADHIIEYV